MDICLMMMLIKTLIIIPLVALVLSFYKPQNLRVFKTSETEMDTTVANKEDYNITRLKLNDEKKYPWFTKAYAEYIPSAETINILKKYRKHVSFVVYAGSWCDDTHLWLPKFYKTVEQAGIKTSHIKLIGVDENKKPVTEVKNNHGLNADGKIERVPVFYIFYKGKEVGKIVESPPNIIEEDILEILKPAFVKRSSS